MSHSSAAHPATGGTGSTAAVDEPATGLPATGVAATVADDVDPTLEHDVFAERCTSRSALQHVTGRWGALALGALADGPARFNALRRRVAGVSEKMLAQTLQALERDGFVHRDVQAAIPPRVEYRLTPLGADVAARLVDLIRLVETSMPDVERARAAYDDR